MGSLQFLTIWLTPIPAESCKKTTPYLEFYYIIFVLLPDHRNIRIKINALDDTIWQILEVANKRQSGSHYWVTSSLPNLPATNTGKFWIKKHHKRERTNLLFMNDSPNK